MPKLTCPECADPMDLVLTCGDHSRYANFEDSDLRFEPLGGASPHHDVRLLTHVTPDICVVVFPTKSAVRLVVNKNEDEDELNFFEPCNGSNPTQVFDSPDTAIKAAQMLACSLKAVFG